MDLEDALRHHDGWSEETRLYIRSEMDRIGAATFRNDVHGYWNSVKVYDAAGEFLADILKTKVWYAATVAPEGATEVNSWGQLAVLLDGVSRSSHASGRQAAAEPAPCLGCNLVHAEPECW